MAAQGALLGIPAAATTRDAHVDDDMVPVVFKRQADGSPGHAAPGAMNLIQHGRTEAAPPPPPGSFKAES